MSNTDAMMKKVRNRESPITTWFGGACITPRAWRNSESTITTRVNAVIINRMAGRKLSAERNSRVWTDKV
ncbi:hypothetical protein D3C72_2514940 [compost metagenome]